MARSAPVVYGVSDGPIEPGTVVHIEVFGTPDLNSTTRVSMSGEIDCPLVGLFHVGGLTSVEAETRYARYLKDHSIVLDPKVTITVETSNTGITVLGEIRAPGVYAPSGKMFLSDLLALAGGVTSNAGRVIEITGNTNPTLKEFIPWDPTMHSTEGYDRVVHPGDRIIVRGCGIAYVGGHVAKPGAYPLCGSSRVLLSHLIALAGGILPLAATKHTTIIRVGMDGSRAAQEVDARKVLRGELPDLEIREDDVIYVPPSTVKDALKAAMAFSFSLVAPLLYLYR